MNRALWLSVQRSKGNERCSKWIFITFCRDSRNDDLHPLRDSSTTSVWSTSQSGFIWNIGSADILSTFRIYTLLWFPYTRASVSISQTSQHIVQLQRLTIAPHCRGKNRRRIDLQHAPRQVPGGFLDCFGGHVQSRAADVEEILGRKKPGGTTPQLYRKSELLRCSHFPICLHRNKNCGMYFSDSRTCRAIVLHTEETKNLPEEYNGRWEPQRACTNERS